MVFASGWIYLGIKTSYCTVVFVNETDSSVVEKMLEHLVRAVPRKKMRTEAISIVEFPS